MKVLIVKTSALGDIVHALPVLDLIRGSCPDAAVDWLAEEPFAPLLAAHPFIHRVHPINTRLWRRNGNLRVAWIAACRAVQDLRKERYDLLLDLQGNCKSGFFAFFSGAPLRFGFDLKAAREWPNLFATNVRTALSRADYHITDRSLRIAARAFPGRVEQVIPSRLLPDPVYTSKVVSQLEAEKLFGKKLVLIHSGTTWKTKRFSLELWQEIAAGLCNDGDVHLLLTWANPGELNTARIIQEGLPECASVWPKVDLSELMALLSNVDLVIGGDTGPVHIAAALGVPTVSLFRATHALRNGPRGSNHICLQSPLKCSPCLLKHCSLDSRCSNSIEAHAVLEAARALLAA